MALKIPHRVLMLSERSLNFLDLERPPPTSQNEESHVAGSLKRALCEWKMLLAKMASWSEVTPCMAFQIRTQLTFSHTPVTFLEHGTPLQMDASSCVLQKPAPPLLTLPLPHCPCPSSASFSLSIRGRRELSGHPWGPECDLIV